MAGRPQVGIERLPQRRMSNEPRESMNCKSCRKRKIKCNRLRPTCEACQVFQCPCIYDAVPKKRGPKTDVLEALLKRVDGLEKKLRDEKKTGSGSPDQEVAVVDVETPSRDFKPPKRPQLETANSAIANESAVYSPTPISEPSPSVQQDVLLDTYFTRCHGKSYYILDETTTRQRLQLGQIPTYLVFAIYAVSARYAAHPNGYHAAVRLSEDYSHRARAELDIDEPSVDCLQALLLLSIAFTASGKGKKAYMMLSNGVGMAMALELHRDFDHKIRLTPVEREMRRRLFWTCYLMDRFVACGSKRPSLVSDKSIMLRLPSWCPTPTSLPVEGEFFQNGSNLQYHAGTGKKSQGSSGMLIDIVRILGITNRYLAAGGVKGDSHFPWHSLSNLSKIRQDLDIWASGTQDVFSSVDALFGQPDSTTLVLSKLIYHLIHCLIYRPFLPIDLAELAGTGQHQSWQIEATNLCFLHANAIAELVELGKQSPAIEWPAFVGYCICTAGTVHVHGAHYKGGREGEVFSASADFLSREMQQLSELRYAWSSVQHQRETLQTIYGCHSELVKSLATNPMRYSPVFHLEDFFDRYSDLGQFFDGAHISFSDILVDTAHDAFQGHDIYAGRTNQAGLPHRPSDPLPTLATKWKSASGIRKKDHVKSTHRNSTSNGNGHRGSNESLISPTVNGNPMSDRHMSDAGIGLQHQSLMETPANFANNIPTLAQTPFSPPYTFASLQGAEAFDPMFGMPNLQNGSIPSSVHGGAMEGMSASNAINAGNGINGTNSMSGGNGINGGANYGFNMEPTAMTPGARSTGESTGGESEKDPFLSLLEQLAENEHSRGGPSELDFFLSGTNG
ncbi:fungal-specific transcription factor domain-containing protein [Bisporella sp. PMI_857]|nr:fungal-specific transcription factor domain-containing protein [Bisporella sp. PMI_857]